MSSTTVTFRTDSELKKEASSLFESLGMNLSEALNMFLRQAIKEQRYPCTIDVEEPGDYKNTYPEGFFDLFGAFPDLEMLDEETLNEGFIAEREEL